MVPLRSRAFGLPNFLASACRCVAGGVLIAAVASPAVVSAGPVGVNLYGTSHHFERTYGENHSFQEANFGAGVDFVLKRARRHTVFADLSRYRDSFSEANTYASIAWTHRLIGPLQGGFMLAAASGHSLNDGEPIMAPVPLLSCRFDRSAIHLLYLARVSDINEYPSVAAYATVYPFTPARVVVASRGDRPGMGPETGVQFAAGRHLSLEGWGGASLALRRRDGTGGWRIAVDLEALVRSDQVEIAGRIRPAGPSTHRFDFQARAERLRQNRGQGAFSLLLGVGPILGYTNLDRRLGMRVWRLGATGTCGAEWRPTHRISFAAEQGLDLTLESGHSENYSGDAVVMKKSMKRWTIASRPARIGVTAWFE